MHFASLAGLGFGLILPAILILYLLKRRYTDTLVSSHLLWNRVLREAEANRPWQRLRNNLLLLLQLLAAALLVLASMQPFVYARGAKSETVIVIDRSASMTAAADAAADPDGSSGSAAPLSRLEEAKRLALADWGKPGRSRITLIAMGEEPQLLLTGEQDRSAIRKAIGDIAPSYGKIGYKEAMSLAAALTADKPDGEIVVYTDGQWPEETDGIPYTVPVRVRQAGTAAGAGAAGNLSVVQFGVSREASPSGSSRETAPPGDGNAGAFHAAGTVRNASDAPRRFTLTVYAGQTPADSRQLTLEAGGQTGVSFDGLPAADYYRLLVDGDDPYPLDDSAYAFPADSGGKRALLITDGNLFLEKALQLTGTAVTKAAPSESPPQLKEAVDFVVLDGFQPEADSKEWAGLLASKPVWSIGSGPDASSVALPGGEPVVAAHPVTAHISFADTHISSAQSAALPVWGKALISEGGVPLVIGGTEQGQRRLAFAFSLHDSDLPLRTEFPILVQNAADWLGETAVRALGRETAGTRVDMPLSANTASARWVAVERAAGTAAGAPGSYPAETAAGTVASLQTVPPVPGLYRFEETAGDGTVRASLLEVAADPAEGRLDNRSGLTLSAANLEPGAQAPNGTDGDAASRANDGRDRLPLLRWLALAAALMIFLEWGVYRRGYSL